MGGTDAHAPLGQGARGIDVEALGAQVVAHHAGQAGIVVDEQQAGIGHGGIGDTGLDVDPERV